MRQPEAQLDLWENRNNNKYQRQAYTLPKILDEKVARLHLEKLGTKLDILTPEQADHIGMSVEGLEYSRY